MSPAENYLRAVKLLARFERAYPIAIRTALARSDVARRLARGSVWSLTSSLITRVVGIIQGVLLARTLGVAAFGEWGIVLSTLALLGLFTLNGLSITASKYTAEYRQKARERLGKLLGLLILLACGVGVLLAVGHVDVRGSTGSKCVRISCSQ